MKSPATVAKKLLAEWRNAETRVTRILHGGGLPAAYPIGKPRSRQFIDEAMAVQNHLKAWRNVDIGTVIWEDVNYRTTSGPVSLPTAWRINSVRDWLVAMNNPEVTGLSARLNEVLENTDVMFHELLTRKLTLWSKQTTEQVVQAAELATQLSPGCAEGKPLRLISGLNVDTKFIEKNTSLLIALLDIRYSGAASEQGLIEFLGAVHDSEHWVLVVPLDETLLPYPKLRLTTSDLTKVQIPGTHLVVVENERCRHLLPKLQGTVAILGCGLNLEWLQNHPVANKQLAYWGDLDCWGLTMLAKTRSIHNHVEPLLMDEETFRDHAVGNAVPEPTKPAQVPIELTPSETALYHKLDQLTLGRLEQEFLPEAIVHGAFKGWRGT